MGGIAGLLGGVYGQVTPTDTGLLIGTVQTLSSPSATILLDGSDTSVTATLAKTATATSIGDRVLVARLGQTCYILTNITGKAAGFQVISSPPLGTALLSSYPVGWSYMVPLASDTTWPGANGGNGIVETTLYANGYGYQTWHDYGSIGAASLDFWGEVWMRHGWTGGWTDWSPVTQRPVGAQGYLAAAQSLPNAVFTDINFTDSALAGFPAWQRTINPATGWSVPFTGYYEMNSQITFVGNVTGVRAYQFKVNGVSVRQANMAPVPAAGDVTSVPIHWSGRLNSGDYLEWAAFQRSTIALATTPGSAYSFFDIRLRP
jgi:hypothetical protein